MPLTGKRTQQLDQIVAKMAAQNAPREDVVAVVNDFTNKYANEQAAPSQPARPTFSNRPTPVSPAAQSISQGQFPNQGFSPTPDPRMLAGVGLAAGATLAPELLLPAGAAEASGVAGLLARAGANVVTGLGQSAGLSVANRESPAQTVKEGGLAALLSALVPEGLGQLGSGVRKATGAAAGAAMNALVPTPAKVGAVATEDIGKGLLDRGISGTLTSMKNQVLKLQQEAGAKIGELIKANPTVKVDIQPVVAALEEFKIHLMNIPGEGTAANARIIDNVINGFKTKGDLVDKLLPEAQTLKQGLQNRVGSRGFQQTEPGALKRDAQKLGAQVLRNQIEAVLPDIAPHNANYTFAANAENQLTKQIESKNSLPQLVRKGSEMAGLVASLGHGLPILLAERAATEPVVVSNAAKLGNKVSQKTLSPTAAKLLRQALTSGSAAAGRSLGK